MPADLLIALGGAETVWDDLARAQAIVGDVPYDVGGVNEAARDYPGHLSYWMSLHPEKLGRWQRERRNAGRNDDYITCSHKNHPEARVDHVYREILAGSSGLYICTTAITLLNYERVIVCGVPMDARPHYHSPANWEHAYTYQRWWREAATQRDFAGRIKSMSGYTRDLLGEPDQNWINQ